MKVNAPAHYDRDIGKQPTAAQEEFGMKVDAPSNDSDSIFGSGSDSESDSDSDSSSKLGVPEPLFPEHLIHYLEHCDLDGYQAYLKGRRHDSALMAFKSILDNIDEENFKRSVSQALSMFTSKLPPLHQLAIHGGFRLTALFLEHGEDPNIRIPTLNPYAYPNMMLPLNAVLCSMTRGMNLAVDFDCEGAAVRLICFLCYKSQTQRLETARLLASKTKELDQEIYTYMVRGCVPELGVLMLLGYRSRVSSLLHCCKEYSKELMEELVDIFNRVGDKLLYYVKLQALMGVNNDRVKMDIALLCKDVYYQVPTKYILCDGNFYFRFDRKCGRKRYYGIRRYSLVFNLELLYDDFRTWGRMFRDVIRGSRSLDASSISRTRKFVERHYLSNNFAIPGVRRPCSPSFLLRVLRRATRI